MLQHDRTSSKGKHGYDNNLPSMRTIFLARGPGFKTGYQSIPFNNVDIYELMCTLLNLEPAPNNGTLENVLPMLKETAHGARRATAPVSTLSMLAVLTAVIFHMAFTKN